MEEQQTHAASIREIRNVPETINATIDFLRLHRRPLGKLLLTRALPLFLLGQVISVYSITMGRTSDSYAVGDTGNGTLQFILLAALTFIGYTLLIGIVYSYFRLAREYEPHEFDQSDVWEDVKDSFWRVLGTNLGLVVLLGVGGYIFLRIGGAVVQTVPVLGLLVAVAFVMFFATIWSLYYPARFIEDRGFYASFGRSQRLVQGRFWGTAGFLITWYLLIVGIPFIFWVVNFIILMLLRYGGIGGQSADDGTTSAAIISTCLSTVFTTAIQLFSVGPLASLAFFYYSQVERKEHGFLEAEIALIGAGNEHGASIEEIVQDSTPDRTDVNGSDEYGGSEDARD